LKHNFDRLVRLTLNKVRDDVRAGNVYERPDGKHLALQTRMVERLSKKSILEAYGKERGEALLEQLRKDGALVEVEEEMLVAK
jgi:hypothetical protein